MAANQTPETPETKKHPFGLSDRHFEFSLGILKYGNYTTAYMAAYKPDNPNLTRSTARRNASYLLKTHPDILLYVHTRRRRHELTTEQLLARDALMANYDASDLYDENGVLLPPSKWGDLGQIIEGIQEHEYTDSAGVFHMRRTVKLASRDKARERLYKQRRLYPDKARLDPVEIESIMLRAYIAQLPPAEQVKWKAAAAQEIARREAQKPPLEIDITPKDKDKNRKTR